MSTILTRNRNTSPKRIEVYQHGVIIVDIVDGLLYTRSIMENESETRFTAGPWAVHRHGAIVGGPFQEYTNGSSQEQIAMVCILSATEGDAVGERDANAHLIAAAPDLLAALKLALSTPGMIRGRAEAEAAITKAEPQPVKDQGESPEASCYKCGTTGVTLMGGLCWDCGKQATQIVTPLDDEQRFSKY